MGVHSFDPRKKTSDPRGARLMRCSKCNKHGPYHSFATFRSRKGETRRRGICKECRGKQSKQSFEEKQAWRKKYNAKNRSEKRQKDFERRLQIKAIVDGIKSKAKCADCRKKFPPIAMDFDHIKGKNRSISNLVSGAYKIDLILEEIKLCEIVCACCHRIRTAKRKQNHAPKKEPA